MQRTLSCQDSMTISCGGSGIRDFWILHIHAGTVYDETLTKYAEEARMKMLAFCSAHQPIMAVWKVVCAWK